MTTRQVLPADSLALVKFVHVIGGIYIWDFVLNLDYDYSIIMRKRKFNRTQPIYLGCRWCTLLAVITQLVGLDTAQGIDCRVWLILNYIFGYLSVLLASSLIILRIYALWEGNKVVTAVTSICWLANAGSYIYSLATFGGERVGIFCEVDHILHNRIYIFCTFITDLVLLVLMLTGVLRWKGGGEKGSIWWLLYTQGLAWVVIFTLAEVPPVVFIVLNLNYAMNRMFLIPAVVVMSIGASRIYLELVNSPEFNNPPVRATGVKEWGSSETRIQFSDLSTHSYPVSGDRDRSLGSNAV
ncbi:hypothetical protein BJV74DRAFT_165734 [Russula compacta]|nr:hypothetical protein BJV74DRAFT_165734 [Russula compacta]